MRHQPLPALVDMSLRQLLGAQRLPAVSLHCVIAGSHPRDGTTSSLGRCCWGFAKKESKTMLKRLVALGLAGALTLIASVSFAQPHAYGRYCGPPQYDSSGAPTGPYC